MRVSVPRGQTIGELRVPLRTPLELAVEIPHPHDATRARLPQIPTLDSRSLPGVFVGVPRTDLIVYLHPLVRSLALQFFSDPLDEPHESHT